MSISGALRAREIDAGVEAASWAAEADRLRLVREGWLFRCFERAGVPHNVVLHDDGRLTVEGEPCITGFRRDGQMWRYGAMSVTYPVAVWWALAIAGVAGYYEARYPEAFMLPKRPDWRDLVIELKGTER